MNLTAFIGLWKKEWHLMRMYFFILLVFDVIWVVAGKSFFQDSRMIMVSSILMVFHLFLLAALLMYSLNKEADQIELFLHSPQSAFLLIGVKFIQSLMYLIASLVFVNIISIFTAKSELVLNYPEMLMLLGIADLYIIVLSLSLAILLFFLWVIHQIMKTYIGGLSVIISIGLFFVITNFASQFQGSALYEAITSWGEIQWGIPELASAGIDLFNFTNQGALTLGEILFSIISHSVMLIISVMILDRRVEV